MKIVLRVLGIVFVAAALLTIPPASVSVDDVGQRAGFVWAQDSLWQALEYQFVTLRRRDCGEIVAAGSAMIDDLGSVTIDAVRNGAPANDPLLDSLEVGFFRVGPLAAACSDLSESYQRLYQDIRDNIKRLSRRWDVTEDLARNRLYRLLFGGRAAVEEVVLQHQDRADVLHARRSEPSPLPAATVFGVEVRSGDMLVSRGGYPTSALIARGSDYPGNFSHVALLHVDQQTGALSTVESHIEIGVAVSTAEQYLEDKKLRILLLRLRSDLPQLTDDPMLPHKAAEAAITRARNEHVAYDFAMDYKDPTRLFCSEVASAAYAPLGVDLWMGISRISNPGLRRWLASFGVRHFETQEPSDLEYDPQLDVIAEWRDPQTLFKDHVDNAVTDAMLEGAERGDAIEFAWYQLPPARILKGYSWVREFFGGAGPIPEGMSPAAALRNRSYTERHARLAAFVVARSDRFLESSGYVAPYWQLLDFAREAVASERRTRLN